MYVEERKTKKRQRDPEDTERWVATVGKSSNSVRACGLFALWLKSAGGVLYSPGAAGTGTVWANSPLFFMACSVGASVGIWEWGRESEKERECNRGRSRCTCVTRISIPTCRRPSTSPHQLSVILQFSSSAMSISPPPQLRNTVTVEWTVYLITLPSRRW